MYQQQVVLFLTPSSLHSHLLLFDSGIYLHTKKIIFYKFIFHINITSCLQTFEGVFCLAINFLTCHMYSAASWLLIEVAAEGFLLLLWGAIAITIDHLSEESWASFTFSFFTITVHIKDFYYFLDFSFVCFHFEAKFSSTQQACFFFFF